MEYRIPRDMMYDVTHSCPEHQSSYLVAFLLSYFVTHLLCHFVQIDSWDQHSGGSFFIPVQLILMIQMTLL